MPGEQSTAFAIIQASLVQGSGHCLQSLAQPPPTMNSRPGPSHPSMKDK